MILFRNSAELVKLNTKINKHRKQNYIYMSLDIFMGLCASTVLVFVSYGILVNLIIDISGLLIFAFVLILFGDALNIMKGFQKESVYSLDKTIIFPNSKLKHFIYLYYSQLLSSRFYLYTLPLLVTFFVLTRNNLTIAFIFLILWFSIYLINTGIISGFYYLTNFLYCKFGDNLQKVILFLIFIFIIALSFLSEFIKFPKTEISWLNNYIITLIR
jgi:hypothetical protein